MSESANRIKSLEYMRALAVLLVLYAHVVVVGTTDVVTPSVFFPMIQGAPLAMESLGDFAHFYLWPEIFSESIGASTGHVGVALFFLISGYVIVHSVEKFGTFPFLAARAFRIFPLCMSVTVGSAIAFALYNALYGQDSPYTVPNVLATSFLLPGITSQFYVLPVIWSLIVEVFFYCIIAGVYFFQGRIDLSGIVTAALLCALVVAVGIGIPTILGEAPAMINAVRHIAYIAGFVIYILVGSVIYLACRPGASIPRCLVALIFLTGLYFLSWYAYEFFMPGQLRFSLGNVVVAMAIFILALIFNRKIRDSRLAQFFASISYPLYLIHIPFAWALMFELSRRGLSPHLNFLATGAACILLAYVLHVLVEMPSHRFGRNLARSWVRRSKRKNIQFGAVTGSGY